MQFDWWGARSSLVDRSGTVIRDADGVGAIEIDRLETVVGALGADVGLALAVGGLLVLGGGLAAVARSRSSGPTADPDADSSPEPTDDDGSPDADPLVAFEERIGDGTLERLEPIAPDAVQRVRDLAPTGPDDTGGEIERMERELRHGIEDAIAAGRFDPVVTSTFGEPYEIVNLPGRYREVTDPRTGDPIHVADVEAVARDALADEAEIRAVARTVATLHDHCREIETYVERQEDAVVDRHAAVEETVANVRELTGRLEDALGERVGEFVRDGRHGELTGVVEIERRLEAAVDSLHRCAFDDAKRRLRETRAESDDLLVTVDFLGGLLGTIDHGDGRVEIPDAVPVGFVTDLVPIIERQYDVAAEVDGRTVVVDDRSGAGTDDASETPSLAAERSGGSADRTADRSRTQVTPDSVADEVLFVLRELEGNGGRDSVECQTERLPDAVASPEVLEELTTFCRRQTDVVAGVELQEGAPPGFLEIEFADGTGANAGLETLRSRFVDRYGR